MNAAAANNVAHDAWERPAGRFDHVPSRVSGRTLTFFSPDPFPDLLGRYASVSSPSPMGAKAKPTGLRDVPEALLLVRGALSNKSDRSRFDEARAFIDVLAARPPFGMGRSTLVSLGLLTSHAPRRVRHGVAFSGARVASDGHVFAPDGEVDALFESLCRGLSAPPAHTPVPVLVACAAFHALHVHPFVDGNGRWARLLAAWIGHANDDANSGVAHACLLQLAKPRLVEREWPHARARGLGAYLARCLAFEARVLEGLSASGFPDAMATLHAGLMATMRSPNLRMDLLAQLIAHGRLGRNDLKRVAALSSRALDGALLRMAEGSGCRIDSATGDVDADALMTQLDAVFQTALRTTFKD